MQALRALTRLQYAASELKAALPLVESATASSIRTFWGRPARCVRVPVKNAEVVAISHPGFHDAFWNPVAPLARAMLEDVQAEMKLLRSNFWSDFRVGTHSKDRVFFLPAEVKETKSHFKILTDVPGIERENVKVKVSSEGMLEISAVRTEAVAESAEAAAESAQHEFKLRRVFRLPEEVDREGIKAQLKNGRLEVVLPKVPSPAPVEKEVEIAMS